MQRLFFMYVYYRLTSKLIFANLFFLAFICSVGRVQLSFLLQRLMCTTSIALPTTFKRPTFIIHTLC